MNHEFDAQETFCDLPYRINGEGVFYSDPIKPEATPLHICAPLYVVAKTRDATSGEWGRLLKWRDDDGREHEWAMPLAKLEGDGLEVRQELARGGLHIGQQRQAREHLAQYIKSWPVENRVKCVDRLGWHGGVYVTATDSLGQADEDVLFQGTKAMEPAMSCNGTLEQWRDSVARLAAGNSRLVMAISTAFAGPLLNMVGEPSGGFHLRGASSSGKSTALKLAASVWGHPKEYMRVWKTTLNGLEGLASQHNDNLLILDEIGQMNPAEVGEAAYMLANEQGKARASRNGASAKLQKWRLLFLSAGEDSLSSLLAQAGKRVSVGQEIRFADIEADAGCGMGIIEVLHGFSSSAALVPDLVSASETSHGVVGRVWLARLVEHHLSLPGTLREQCRSLSRQWVPAHASGQISRVAHRFALVALAGELASDYKLTGWKSGEAISGVKKCFDAWLEGYGGLSNREDRVICDQVLGLLAAHGSSRFQDMQERIGCVPNRLGYWRKTMDGYREYLIPAEPFKNEFCKGLDPKRVVKTLETSGILVRPAKGNQHTVRLPDAGPTKVYVLRHQSMDTLEAALPDSTALV